MKPFLNQAKIGGIFVTNQLLLQTERWDVQERVAQRKEKQNKRKDQEAKDTTILQWLLLKRLASTPKYSSRSFISKVLFSLLNAFYGLLTRWMHRNIPKNGSMWHRRTNLAQTNGTRFEGEGTGGHGNTRSSRQCTILFLLYCLWMPLLVYKSVRHQGRSVGTPNWDLSHPPSGRGKEKKREKNKKQKKSRALTSNCAVFSGGDEVKTSSFQKEINK